MKIRTGYVSNSSSSSFVFAFDKKPETLGELVDLIGHIPAAQAVWACIQKKTPLQGADVKHVLERDHWGCGDDAELGRFLSEHAGKVFLVAEIGDHHGEVFVEDEAAWEMESGVYFSKVPHVRIDNR